MNIYFNRNFSSIEIFFKEIKKNDKKNKIKLFYTRDTTDIKSKYATVLKEPKNIEGYIDFCKNNKIDYFYPWKNIELFFGHEKEFSKIGTTILLPTKNLNTYNLIDNKNDFYNYIQEIIPELIPNFDIINTQNDFDRVYNSLKTDSNELCMKPSRGIYAAGFKRILDKEDNNFFNKIQNNNDKYSIERKYLKSILPNEFDDIILIEYIDGDEFSYDVFCDKGKIVFGTIRQKHKYESDFQTIIRNKFIEKVTKKIVKKMKLSNFQNFQFIANKSGEIYILEINPRMSGGIPQCNLSGINYSELFIDCLNKKDIKRKLGKQKSDIKVFSKRKYFK